MKKILFLLFLFLSLSFAVERTVPIHYYDPYIPQYEWFDTTQKFILDTPQCTFSGKILEGDPCKEGISKVCQGGVITYTPRIEGIWGGSNTDIIQDMFGCSLEEPPYCPNESMSDYNAKLFYPIKWLSYSDYYKFDYENGKCPDSYVLARPSDDPIKVTKGCIQDPLWFEWMKEPALQIYKDLGGSSTYKDPFSVTYINNPGFNYYYNKKAYPVVFCYAKYELKDGSNVYASGEMPASDLKQHTIIFNDNPGSTHPFGAKLYDIGCFASSVRHPRDDTSHTNMFAIQFYGRGFDMSPNSIIDSHAVKVVDPRARMEVLSTEIVAKDGFGNYLLKTTVKNTGDSVDDVSIKVNGTYAELPGSYAEKSTSQKCNSRFSTKPVHECDDSNPNGYDTNFNPGQEMVLYTIFSYPGKEEDLCNQTIMTLEYTSDEKTCSAYDSWKVAVNGPCGVPKQDLSRCEINPPNLIVNPFEIHEWTVTCFDENNKQTACAGNDWRFDGLKGEFLKKTNQNALAYISEDGTGKIVYVQGSMRCNATVISDTHSFPYMSCVFNPSSAQLNVSETEEFNLRCSISDMFNRRSINLVSTEYDAVNGLVGDVKPDPVDRSLVNFTGTEPSFGKLRGIAWYTYSGEPTLRGAVAFAPIDVNSAELVCDENKTKECHTEVIDTPFGPLPYEVCECVPKNETQPGGQEGKKTSCVISPPNQQISPLQPGWATVTCFDKEGQIDCGSVKWSIDNNNLANLLSTTNPTVVFTAKPGAQGTGTITADVGNNVECEAKFEVSPYTCLEIS